MQRNRGRGERGQTTALLAVFIVPVLAMTALSVDAGRMYGERRKIQAAVDLAVSAGAHEAIRPASERTSFQEVASAYLTKNGFTTDKGDRITLHNPPRSGPHAGNPNAYEVIVDRPMPTTLMRLLGPQNSSIQGRAVALVKKTGIGILVLDEHKCKAFHMKGDRSSLKLNNGMLHVNSDCSNEAMNIEDKSRLILPQPATVVGGVKVHGNSETRPLPETGADVVEDPLADLPAPPTTLPLRNVAANYNDGKCASGDRYRAMDGETLCPGIYHCGILIGDRVSVTFDTCGMPPSEAVYVLDGGRSGKKALEVKKMASVTGHGITVYVAPHPQAKLESSGYRKCGDTKFDKNATVELTAPTDGTYEGILLVADRDCKKRNLKLHQNIVSGMVGEIYTPTWKVELKGGKKKNDPPGGFDVSIISKELKIDKHFDAEELDELDEPYLDEFGNPIYDPDYDPAVPNLVFNALSGGSARRIVLGE